MSNQHGHFVPPRRTEVVAPFVDINGWTAAASELRIRILLNRTSSPDVDRALAYEAQRLAAIRNPTGGRLETR